MRAVGTASVGVEGIGAADVVSRPIFRNGQFLARQQAQKPRSTSPKMHSSSFTTGVCKSEASSEEATSDLTTGSLPSPQEATSDLMCTSDEDLMSRGTGVQENRSRSGRDSRTTENHSRTTENQNLPQEFQTCCSETRS